MDISSKVKLNSIQPNIQVKNSDLVKKQAQNFESGFELPDIRGSQILLPDNKIYVPQAIVLPKGSKPSGFNMGNISLEVPEHYQELQQDDLKNKLSKIFKNRDISIYDNTKTSEKVIRISKNNFDDKGVLDSSEVMEISAQNSNIGIKYIKDYEHNTETETIQRNPLNPRKSSILSKTTIYKDDNGKVIKTEEYTKSPFLKGVFDIVETDANGNKTIVSQTYKREDGTIVLERNLVSLDGTKTTYRYETDEAESHKRMFCQITDKDGNVLSTIDRTYDKENENETYSTINGNKYKIEKKRYGIAVTDYTKNERIPIENGAFQESSDTRDFIKLMDHKSRKFSDENVTEKLFDTLPADTLLTLDNNIKEIIPLEDDLDSAFLGVFDFLMCKTDNFVINHELGHSKDAIHVKDDDNLLHVKKGNVIADDKDFRKAYIEEKAEFIKAFPDFEEKYISYFINSPESNPEQGRKETVAESNAINGLQPQEPDVIAMRTIVLQRYFPRSMAILTNMMNPIAHTEQQISEK
ncbi:hypothetical protein IJG14_02395 [bacterium]|nr:hypothetical protein [bacterium]